MLLFNMTTSTKLAAISTIVQLSVLLCCSHAATPEATSMGNATIQPSTSNATAVASTTPQPTEATTLNTTILPANVITTPGINATTLPANVTLVPATEVIDPIVIPTKVTPVALKDILFRDVTFRDVTENSVKVFWQFPSIDGFQYFNISLKAYQVTWEPTNKTGHSKLLQSGWMYAATGYPIVELDAKTRYHICLQCQYVQHGQNKNATVVEEKCKSVLTHSSSDTGDTQTIIILAVAIPVAVILIAAICIYCGTKMNKNEQGYQKAD